MPGQSRVAQPISPPPNIAPAPSNPFPARPTRLRLKTTANAISASPHHVEFDTVVEDIGFGVSAPITDITIPRKGLWLVYMYVLLPHDGDYAVAVAETTLTGTVDAWEGGFLTQIPAPTLSGSQPTAASRHLHLDITAGTIVSLYLQIQSANRPVACTVDAILNLERISYGGTAGLT